MTQDYNIKGMTCSGCIESVKNRLLGVKGVEAAMVQLAAPQAQLSVNRSVSLEELQLALGAGKYSISEVATVTTEMVAAQKGDSYYPIFLIFGYIAGATLLQQMTHGSFLFMHWMGQFMAGFFLVFSFFKLLNLEAFAQGYRTYDIVAKKIPVYGYVYPFIELLLGIAYITGFEPQLINVVTLLVMGVSTIGVAMSLAKKTQFRCACLGTIINLPLSKVTLFEDLLMVAMSAVMLMLD